MKDYHDLYLRCNALLFANVFEKFKFQKFMWLCNIQIFSNKWIQINKFDLNKYTSNHLKGYILEIDLKNPKQLWELQNTYPLAPEEIEIKREILSECQLKIADLYNIPISNAKKLVSNILDKEKYVLHYENWQLYLRLISKLKKYIPY